MKKLIGVKELMKTETLFKDELDFKEVSKNVELPKQLNSLFVKAVKNYELAKNMNDEKRVVQFKNDALQCIFLNKNLLRCKVVLSKSAWGTSEWTIERLGCLKDKRIDKLVKSKGLPESDNYSIPQPQKLADYSDTIPGSVYKKIDKINKVFEDKNKNFFIADVDNDPDPILFVQIDKNKDYTFAVGFWL